MSASLPLETALLAAWERGRPRGAPERAVAMLAAAYPGHAPAELAALPVGRRDDLLLALRAQLFGPHCRCVAQCPTCGDRLEFDLALEQLRAPPPAPLPPGLELAGRAAGLRLPDSYDLAAARAAATPEAARRALLVSCLVGLDGAPSPDPDELSAAEVAAVAEWLSTADPQADIAIDLRCPTCGAAWPAPFAIDEFVWAEVASWAERTLREVHRLARGYGWREPDILALSAARRRHYLELLTNG